MYQSAHTAYWMFPNLNKNYLETLLYVRVVHDVKIAYKYIFDKVQNFAISFTKYYATDVKDKQGDKKK